jgi:hypothetical protein
MTEKYKPQKIESNKLIDAMTANEKYLKFLQSKMAISQQSGFDAFIFISK